MYKGGGYIMAGRNAHASLITASALLGFDIKWLYSEDDTGYISCEITAQGLDKALSDSERPPFCVYITSPDYLGNICDIRAISRVCEKHGVLLLVDNAHGSYLKFAKEDLHPISLGAHMCCDSAHKTLPVLTGGAYLHISKALPSFFIQNAKSALSTFASTSPSYLILSSLDKANQLLATDFRNELEALEKRCDLLRIRLVDKGYSLVGDEVIKITVDAKKYGYTGTDLASILRKSDIVCEFYDEDYLVLMLSTQTDIKEIDRLEEILLSVEKRVGLLPAHITISPPKAVMSPRDAYLSQRELVPIDQANGRILAGANVFCPPAVSLIVAGERFTPDIVNACKRYGFTECFVVKE